MKRSEIKPGESFYVISVDVYGSNMIGPTGQSFPRAYKDSRVWKLSLEDACDIPLGAIVTVTQKPGKGDLVKRICKLYGKAFKDLVEVIHGDEICVVSTSLLYPIHSPMAIGIIQATQGKWPEDISDEEWDDLDNLSWDWKV